MQKVTGIGGLFFRARDPDGLADWYRTHLGVERIDGFWSQAAGPTVFAPMRDTTDYFADAQRWMVNFRVDDLDAMVEQLKQANIEVITKADCDSDFGRFARIHDPERNPIELWEPGPAAPPA